MHIDLIDHMGTDLDVVNAARVSFSKSSVWDVGGTLKDRDARLIRYLATHGHWSPFSHCFAKFKVTAPIFVARQLGKHQVGFSWNEVSRRYVDHEPQFFYPDCWRNRSEDVKQGSSDNAVNDEAYVSRVYEEFSLDAAHTYHHLLKLGVAPEQARMVLPQSTYTEWIWSGSLMAWARMCNLRLSDYTQEETRGIVSRISEKMRELFPVSWAALKGIDDE